MSGKIEHLRMEPVQNGHKITFMKRSRRDGGDDFSPTFMKDCEYVFKDSEIKQAMDKYVELAKEAREEEKEY